jgi:uncharacterized membrane protein
VNDDIISLLFLLCRWLHVVATCTLVGGTLFYELIFPLAIDELRDEQKLWIFARARWAFRWIVWCSAIVLIASGAVSTWRNWDGYTGDSSPQAGGAGLYWLLHVVVSLLGVIVAVALVRGRTPPRYPLVWMRINLMILLVAILLASAARHVRLRLLESQFQHPSRTID